MDPAGIRKGWQAVWRIQVGTGIATHGIQVFVMVEPFNIPGMDWKGQFTYYDLPKMKADGIDPSRVPR